MLKSKVGMPAVQFSGTPIDLPAEARRARARLYPVTVVYSLYAMTTLALALLFGGSAWVTGIFFALGLIAWTIAEYLVHRYVLHWRFPDGAGLIRHWLHVRFDNLHSEHHARPWDGNHINGTIKDTLIFVVFFGGLSLLAPIHTAPVFWAALIQAYVIEEWVHQSTHYPVLYGLKNRYWRYITRHHAYHHSPRGSELAFGLTSGLWDYILVTRIPAKDRALLYAGKHGRRA